LEVVYYKKGPQLGPLTKFMDIRWTVRMILEMIGLAAFKMVLKKLERPVMVQINVFDCCSKLVCWNTIPKT
jgi:hypothetical protein